MDKNIDDVSEQIDTLLLRKLELMEEKTSTIVKMETILRNGHIELAKAKYILGQENVSVLQIPVGENIMPLFELETNIEEPDKIIHFDISSKKTNEKEVKLKDPLKWFGILIPQNLRTAQKCFQDSLYLAVKVANIQAELSGTLMKLQKLHSLKDHLKT